MKHDPRSSFTHPTRRETPDRAPRRRRPATEAKRALIVETAMRHFAERGYQAARVEDITTEIGIAKGSIFQHFGSKEGLFLAAYKESVSAFEAYLEAPAEVLKKGFFAILRYWLTRTGRHLSENWIPYRVTLLGNYGTDLRLRREINRFLFSGDPYGTISFVRWGIERGQVRSDIDPEMIVSLVDWMMGNFQDALLTEELDPGLFRRRAGQPVKTDERIDQFIKVLRGAIGGR
jgi:AcrR family transcriptional regulator